MVIIINVIKTGGCVVLCLGIGVCMLMYVVKLPETCSADLVNQ